ncbi:TIGR03545 family protein [Aliidiomarina celeris]|uniref:TIGR03545 family protein n=1 Tax=Aliidiomarina celeris TaxID=2249428 RepID=UPI000DEBCB2B|nr:TIGR03545 family protein [Aliidiomarina celeris]
MKQMIRWPGLLAFVVVFGGIALLLSIFLEPLAKTALQSTLTRLNGAEVNIAEVEIQRAPFAVTVKGLEMTDPQTPELNRLQVTTLRAEVAFLELLIGRVHIQDLTAAGVRFAQPRASAGAVRTREPAQDQQNWRERLESFDIELPSTESVLAGANIQTPALIEQVETQFKEREAQFNTAREQLPSTEKVEEYQQRIETILDSKPSNARELLAAREALKEIKDEIEADRERVREFLAVARGTLEATQQDVRAIRQASEQDLARAQELLRFDPQALTELSGILFGQKVEQWAQYGLVAFDFIAPMLNRAQQEQQSPSRWEGRYIEFDGATQPTFWLKNAAFDVILEPQNATPVSIAASLKDLTWQHDRIGRATTFAVNNDSAPWWQELALSGDFYVNAGGDIRGAQRWQLAGAALNNLQLIEQTEFAAQLTEALLNSQGEIALNAGVLSGGGALDFSSVDFGTGGESSWARYFEQALDSVQAFDIQLGISGEMASPQFQIGSNLDNQLASSLQNMAQQEASDRLAEVRASLNARTEGVLSELRPWLERAEALQAQGVATEDIFAELLRSEVGDVVDAERERLLRRLGERLGGGG